jgi:AmiR/NasT family two-component response regulator
VIDAINKGEVYRYVQKPWDEDDLRFIINSAYELFDLRQKNGELTDKLKKVNKQL